jgi:hypothetical protein
MRNKNLTVLEPLGVARIALAAVHSLRPRYLTIALSAHVKEHVGFSLLGNKMPTKPMVCFGFV